MFVGRLTDKRNKRGILRLGSIVYAIAWVLRLFTRSGMHVFAVDTLSRVSKNTLFVPLAALTYDRALRRGVMKSMVFFEMSLSIGKILAAGLVILLATLYPPGWDAAFLLAGGMTLLYLLL